MTPENAIIEYIARISKGFLKLDQAHAAEVVRLAHLPAASRAVKWRFANDGWDLLQTIPVTDEQIQVAAAAPEPADRRFYKYECFDSQGNRCTIWSVDPHLFQR